MSVRFPQSEPYGVTGELDDNLVNGANLLCLCAFYSPHPAKSFTYPIHCSTPIRIADILACELPFLRTRTLCPTLVWILASNYVVRNVQRRSPKGGDTAYEDL